MQPERASVEVDRLLDESFREVIEQRPIGKVFEQCGRVTIRLELFPDQRQTVERAGVFVRNVSSELILISSEACNDNARS